MLEVSKEYIKMNYETACYEYLKRLLFNWGYGDCTVSSVGWWVGDDIGGLFCFEDDTFINMDEIRYCVDNDVSQETYNEYIEYNLKCSEYGFENMNLNAFVKGAPRIQEEAFDGLDKQKKMLEESIERLKEKLNNKSD